MGTAKKVSRSTSLNGAQALSVRLLEPVRFGHEGTFERIPLQAIDQTKRLCQFRLDDAEFKALARGLTKHGQLVPILVRRNGDVNEIIDGYHRVKWLAAQGNRDVLACVFTGLSDEEAVAMAYACNADRKSLSRTERAFAIAQWLTVTKRSKAEASEQFGVSTRQIDRDLKLLELSEELQAAVKNGLPMGHALELHKHPRLDHAKWIGRIGEESLSLKELRRRLKQSSKHLSAPKSFWMVRGSHVVFLCKSIDFSKLSREGSLHLESSAKEFYVFARGVSAEKHRSH